LTPFEQLTAYYLFKLFKILRNGGLRSVQFFAGTYETAIQSDCSERPQVL
jgi:hypothetical protein